VGVNERKAGLSAILIDPDSRDVRIIRLSEDYLISGKGTEQAMFQHTKAFSGFAVNDVPAAKQFYEETLGMDVTEEHGMLQLHIGNDARILVCPKPDHAPATFTILNLPVDESDAAVDELVRRGIAFERYDNSGQDDKGIARGGGPYIAWFKDPAGNILSVIQD